jgi:dihydrofolate reductase
MINGIPVEVIVAIDEDFGYAKGGVIPWHYKEDFKWFQQQTKGCVGIMGSKTYDDINKKLGEKAKESVLPGRSIFVLSSTMEPVTNATVVRDIQNFFDAAVAYDPPKIVFMGGLGVYTLGLLHADVVHITRIKDRFSCDSFFPVPYVEQNFHLEVTQRYPEFDIQTWRRVR